MLKVPHEFQLHVTHSCNLTCEGCTHYMNQGHSGSITLEDADEWMSNWNRKVVPKRFTLMGGEPSLHPKLGDFVLLAREKFKHSDIEIVSNGFFLHNHPDLWKILVDTGTVLGVSVHSQTDAVYVEKFKPVYNLMKEWIKKGARVELRPSIVNWQRQYKGYGDNMEPYEDGDPVSSWSNCVSKLCVQLYQGKLWKCPGLAYLPLQAEKYDLSDKWDLYLKYRPLDKYSTKAEIKKFFYRKAEIYCSMCPAKVESFKPEDPLLPVSYWKRKYEN